VILPVNEKDKWEKGNQLCSSLNNLHCFVELSMSLLKDFRGQGSPELVKFFATEGEPFCILLSQIHRFLVWDLQMYKESSPRMADLEKFLGSAATPAFGEAAPKTQSHPFDQILNMRSKNASVFYYFLVNIPASIKGLLGGKAHSFSFFLSFFLSFF